MAGYTIDGTLYLSDTSWRGTHVKAEDALKTDNLVWIVEYNIGGMA